MIVRHVETLFCDDIRHEINGKLSYIGVYSGALLVPAFPATLPKLCVSVKVVTPADEPLRSLTLRVLKDDEILQEIVLDEEQLASALEVFAELSDEERRFRVQMPQFLLEFVPLYLEKACTLRVRALADHSELWGVGLIVDQMLTSSALPT
ncbi:MAG: hypothetical protein KDI73_06110 [Candidatus Competibacteraceae bacterium]|nr:hypothetical protein [Candidatus Competibacteraceae bacterium]